MLRNADLEFGSGSIVEIESKFEKCKILLGENAALTVGPHGVLENCQLQGAGIIAIHGTIKNNQKTNILHPKIFKVGMTGHVISTVIQSEILTCFAFEPGCTLNMKIKKSKK